MGLVRCFFEFLQGGKASGKASECSHNSANNSDVSCFISEVENAVVREVMTPRTNMVCLDIESPLDEIKTILLEWKHSNIPVYCSRIEDVLGVLDLKDISKLFMKNANITHETIKKALKEPYIVPATKKITALLEELLKKNADLALVVDEYGGIIGIVTQKDLCLEIVRNAGFVEDDSLIFDKDGFVSVCADTNIDKVEELFGVEIPHIDFDTVGGLIFNIAGKIPEKGESFKYKDLMFEIAKAEEHKLQKISISKISAS